MPEEPPGGSWWLTAKPPNVLRAGIKIFWAVGMYHIRQAHTLQMRHPPSLLHWLPTRNLILKSVSYRALITVTRPYYVSFHFGNSCVCVPDASNCVVDAFFKGFCLEKVLIVVCALWYTVNEKMTPWNGVNAQLCTWSYFCCQLMHNWPGSNHKYYSDNFWTYYRPENVFPRNLSHLDVWKRVLPSLAQFQLDPKKESLHNKGG
jgi:hypothetical protein